MSQQTTQSVPHPSNFYDLIEQGLKTVPGRIWARQAVMIALAVLIGIGCFGSYEFLRNIAQTVGKDAVPSIVAAEDIRTNLALAHTQVANALLNKETLDGPNMKAYAKSMEVAQDDIVTSAQNITYGDEERRAILATLSSLAQYERMVGELMQTNNTQTLQMSDTLMRDKVMAGASQINLANSSHLVKEYIGFLKHEKEDSWGMFWVGLVIMMVMIESQMYLYKRFKRVLNPALAAGTLVFIVGLAGFTWHAAGEMAAIHSAKEDAFDSMDALTRLKSLAYDANAQESVYLLLNGDAARQGAADKLFQNTTKQIWSGEALLGPNGELPDNLKVLKGQGFIGDELANITFPGELTAATQMLKSWRYYLSTDVKMRTLETGGRHPEAVAFDMSTKRGDSDWAFDQFDTAVGETLKINEEAFDKSMDLAFGHVKSMMVFLVLMVLSIVVGSVVGFQMRLAEYRG